MRKYLSRLLLIGFLAFASPPVSEAQNVYRGMNVGTDITESDIHDLAPWGVNVVRYPLTWGYRDADSGTMEEYFLWLESALAHLDTLLPVFNAYGIKVVINMYSPPGGHASHASPPQHRVFSEQWAQTALVSAWQIIAERYKDNPTIWGYDILNEPAQKSVALGLMSWNQFAPVLAQSIRAIDLTHSIIIEPLYGNLDLLNQLPVIEDPHIVYSFHNYFPNKFINQGLTGNKRAKVTYPGKGMNKQSLAKRLRRAVLFQKARGVPLYVGEFSVVRWAPDKSAKKYLKDLIGLFEQNGFSWTFHSFRESNVWSPEHGSNPRIDTRAGKPTGREQVLRSFFRRNTF